LALNSILPPGNFGFSYIYRKLSRNSSACEQVQKLTFEEQNQTGRLWVMDAGKTRS
jgi:hypothetical protein